MRHCSTFKMSFPVAVVAATLMFPITTNSAASPLFCPQPEATIPSNVLQSMSAYVVAQATPPPTGGTQPAITPAADPAPAAPTDAPATASAPAAGDKMKPIDRVKVTEKGKLKNPYPLTPEVIAEGKKFYMGNSCNGCHGGGGGGGMCPALTNETWVYGSDDDTLYRLITLGSKDLKATGFAPIAKETVTGPMPPYAEIIEDEEKLWKIIAYIRSVFSGRPEKKNW